MRTICQQRGQAAVLAALSLFTMVVFLALAANAGVLVNDRIRMQNTADLTSYAGGFEMARNLNKMATINRKIYDTVQRLRGVLNYGPLYLTADPPDETDVYYWTQPPCSCLDYSPAAQQVIKAGQDQLNGLYDQLVLVNATAQGKARAAATFTASANFLGNFIGPNHLSFFQSQVSSPTASTDLVNLDRVDDTMVGYNYTRSCRCCDGCCLYPQIHTEEITTWGFKADNAIVYFPAKVKGIPEKNFLDFGPLNDRMFGADADSHPGASDMLYGYAVSKPFEGMVGTLQPDNTYYSASPSDYPYAFVPMNPVYPPSTDLEDYFRPSYRARIAGIHEDMGDNPSMAELIQTDSSEPQFQSKVIYFAH